jgi:hypothetical protein
MRTTLSVIVCLLFLAVTAQVQAACTASIISPALGSVVSSPVTFAVSAQGCNGWPGASGFMRAEMHMPFPLHFDGHAGSMTVTVALGAGTYRFGATLWSNPVTQVSSKEGPGINFTVRNVRLTPTPTPTPKSTPTPLVTPTPGPTPTPVGRMPTKANDFLNTLGVDSHLTQGLVSEVELTQGLQFLGVRHWRDDGTIEQAKLQSFCNVHAATGATMTMLPFGGDLDSTLGFLDTLASCGALLDVEGANQPNNFPFAYNGVDCNQKTTFKGCANFQHDLFNAAKADVKLAGLPVFAETEPGAEPDNVGLQFLSHNADFANLHNYVKCNGCQDAFDNVAWHAEAPNAGEGPFDGLQGEFLGQTFFGHFPAAPLGTNLPRVTTETGWDTDSISQDQQGKTLVNVYLSAVARNWTYTFIFQLKDDSNTFGLYTRSFAPKLAATYIHNLTSIVSDNNSNFSVVPLNFSIPNAPATVHSLLLQESDGSYALVVWDDRHIGASDEPVTVDLGRTFSALSIFDVTVGTNPIQTLNNTSMVPLILTDHALVLEF